PPFIEEAEVKVTLLSHQLAPNDSYEGEVKVRSNAGDFSLFVKAYIVQIISKDPPPLTILTPDPEFLTREKRLFILCETSPVAFASINDQRVAVDPEDGIFFLNILLKEGLNQIKVSVWDAYENKKTETILATLDTTPPNIAVDNIPLFSNSDTLIITGKTDQDAELTFNFAPLLVGKDGVFSVSYKAYHTINQLIFTAVDSLGNKRSAIRVFFYKPLKPNQIMLTLGERIGTFNDREFTMDAPPMMSNGRVMVPLRLIADIFGADVLWESSKKQVEIALRFSKIVLKVGSNQAVMNGKTTSLDAPPIIQNGRVMVPIRFISEAFSSEVEWNQEEKRVIIRF
ncbi:MAG: stalk domain-containing protein, partial [Caldisericia bacterium]|nr:stalk domain-containing protein [Caldisericia bacterium]